MTQLSIVYNKDCISGIDTFIKDKSIDMIFTDPPYKLVSGGKTSAKQKIQIVKNSVFSKKTKSRMAYTVPSYESWISKLPRILKDNSYVFSMTNDLNMVEFINLFQKYGFKLCEILVMKKSNKVASVYFYKQCDFILMFRNGKYKKFNKYGISNVFDVTLKRGKEKLHPSEKPVDMISDIIKCCSEEKGIILDPFMGSGSTAIAALKNNRMFQGFEIEKDYYYTAVDRINKWCQNKSDKRL